jgi:hypothetical protein
MYFIFREKVAMFVMMRFMSIWNMPMIRYLSILYR